MGNNSSQNSNVSRRVPVETEQWAHSFPRSPPRMYHHGGAKVLPERDAHLQLRPTNNGEILHSGGTLSGRHHQQNLSLEREDIDPSVFHRSNSISSLHPQEYRQRSDSPPLRSYLAHHRDPLHRGGRYGLPNSNDVKTPSGYFNSNHQKEKMKRFGSEPDLRVPNVMKTELENSQKNRNDRSRGRKKYKAPPPPPGGIMSGMEHSLSDTSNWEGTSNGENNDKHMNNRKARLFKTRAEMKKKTSPYMKRRSVDDSRSAKVELDNKKLNGNLRNNNANRENKEVQRNNRLSLPDMKVSNLPEFQAELKEATKRLRSIKTIDTKIKSQDNNKNNSDIVMNFGGRENRLTKDKLKTLDHNINLKYKMKQMEQQKLEVVERESKLSAPIENVRGPASGKESTPEQSPSRKSLQDKEIKDQPSKTFYFGMDEPIQQTIINSKQKFNSNITNNNNNIVDQFTVQQSAHKMVYQNSSVSDLSSEPDVDDCPVTGNGIALQLRPILPKKQLEIPRFSPAAAWRLLSALESNAPPSTVASDEGPMLIEDRIEKLSRPPPPPTLQIGPRSNHDKSGDSGISGDAGPTGYEDSPDAIVLNPRNNVFQNASSRPHVMSWTPQQDLEGEEESSLEDGVNHNQSNVYSSTAPIKFSPRSHVFSLSLPRDNHLAQYLAPRTKDGQLVQVNVSQDQSDNWFLSRSAPNSLNNGFNSLDLKHTHHIEVDETLDTTIPLVPLVNNTNGRLMYLPECENGNRRKESVMSNGGYHKKQERSKSRDESYNRSHIVNRGLRKSKMIYSKSCENISSAMQLPTEPENLQDPLSVEEEPQTQWKIRKPKRFTFQSTVRQIERKRLADKLSKEAERKEQQRLSELEAMQRVEEEFQKKRAREKASIRQQLRLFSMEDTAWSSLPPNWEANDGVPARPEPDGAVSSSASSSTLDQINCTQMPENKHTKFTKSSKKTDSPKMEEYKKKMVKNGLSPAAKKFASRQSSESSDENKIKAPTTQILSEYRELRREYMDYRGSSRLSDIGHHVEKQTVIHPQVTCNMPKAHQGSSNLESNSSKTNNYRRDFAHGVNPSKLDDLGRYSDDSQSNIKTHSPRMNKIRLPAGRQLASKKYT